MKAQEALKTAEATRATNAVDAAKATRDAAKLQDAAKKAGVLGKIAEGVGKVARPIAKTAGTLFTAQGLKEAATGRQEGETREDEIQRRLMGLGFSALGVKGFEGSGLDVPVEEIPARIGDGFEKWHEQRAIDKAARAAAGPDVSDDAISAKADFMKAVPPTKAAPYSDADYEIGRNYLEHHHANVENIDDTQGMRDALEHERQSIENTVSSAVRRYAKEPITTNVRMDVRTALASTDAIEAGFLDKGMKALEDFNLADPTLEEADAIRAKLNAKTRGIQKKNMWDVATARANDPEFAAYEAASESLRNGIYDQLEAKKVSGAREMRQDESVLIRLRNAADRQIFNGDKVVRGTSEAGSVRKTLAKVAPGVGAATGAGIGGYLGGVIGAEGGALAGGYAGKKVGEAVAPPDMTRDALVQRSLGKRVSTSLPTQLEGTGVPSTPPSEPIPPAPKNEYSPIHVDLATHYSEGIGDTSYQELADRFLSDIETKREHKVPLETAEKSLLNKINQGKIQEILDAKKQAKKAGRSLTE